MFAFYRICATLQEVLRKRWVSMRGDAKETGVMLIRHGEGEFSAADSPLKTSDSGKERRGEPFILRAVKAEGAGRFFDHIFYAPTRICRETTEVFVRHTTFVAANMRIEECGGLHSKDLRWKGVLHQLPEPADMNTFADLKTAEEKAVKTGEASPGFLQAEGGHIFSAIQHIQRMLDDKSVAACVMHSPLIESALLYIWETQTSPRFQALKPIDKVKLLRHLDYFLLVFYGDSFDCAVPKSFVDKVDKKRETDALILELANKMGPRIGR